jgi:glycosyltransferase involved in cell wall biosynthesis
VASSARPALLLTNYRGGGIGDFGLALAAQLRTRLGALEVVETSIDGRAGFRQAARAATYRGPLIVNLGLTAWGRSGVRNFLGFAAVGAHRRRGSPTKVIVHHAIEMFDLGETGYEVSSLVKAGAHAALRRVRKCELTVFSPHLQEILARQYGASHVTLVPFPGDRAQRRVTDLPPGKPRVVHAGYWALYKGIDRYLDVAERLRGRAEFLLVGRPHSALSADSRFRDQVEAWKTRAESVGVRLTGFLTPAQLDSEFTGSTVGLLPYTSVSGASASFNLFAERGVPVVTTDLPEFRYLERMGAGIRIAPSTPEGLASEVASLLGDRGQWLSLSRQQAAFTERYSWEQFVAGLVTGIEHGERAPPAPG